jgi:hypothetical protein
MQEEPVLLREKSGRLAFLQSWLPLIIVAGGAFWTATTWWVVRSDAHATTEFTRRLEAQRPFLAEKLRLFVETAQIAGTLAAHSPDIAHDDWRKAELRFWSLRWSELEMVGNPAIRNAMRRVQESIVELKKDTRNPDLQHDLRWMVECLADELRLSLEVSWGNVRPFNDKGPDPFGRRTLEDLRSEMPSGCAAGRSAPR